jgi:glycosyltransferase involved in cell wall biosynthesis
VVPGIELDIAGDGDARPEVEALVADLGLADRVRIHGQVSEELKVDLLERAVVFATPSMHEGWGLSVIEANTVGCPAVAYDVPGLSVAIQHDRTGLLAQDDESFAGAIATILNDPERRSRYSAAARTWAERFDWDVSARETLRIVRAAPATVEQQARSLDLDLLLAYDAIHRSYELDPVG